MPASALFVGVRDLENRFFAERFAEELQADGQFWRFRKTTRNTDAANTREVTGDGEDVREIHLQRVVRFFTDLECRGRRCRCDYGVYFLKSIKEIFADERADFLCADVVSIVVAAAQNIGAKDDSPFDFRTETRTACVTVKFGGIFAGHACSVTDAVEARQIR